MLVLLILLALVPSAQAVEPTFKVDVAIDPKPTTLDGSGEIPVTVTYACETWGPALATAPAMFEHSVELVQTPMPSHPFSAAPDVSAGGYPLDPQHCVEQREFSYDFNIRFRANPFFLGLIQLDFNVTVVARHGSGSDSDAWTAYSAVRSHSHDRFLLLGGSASMNRQGVTKVVVDIENLANVPVEGWIRLNETTTDDLVVERVGFGPLDARGEGGGARKKILIPSTFADPDAAVDDMPIRFDVEAHPVGFPDRPLPTQSVLLRLYNPANEPVPEAGSTFVAFLAILAVLGFAWRSR